MLNSPKNSPNKDKSQKKTTSIYKNQPNLLRETTSTTKINTVKQKNTKKSKNDKKNKTRQETTKNDKKQTFEDITPKKQKKTRRTHQKPLENPRKEAKTAARARGMVEGLSRASADCHFRALLCAFLRFLLDSHVSYIFP